MRARRAPARVIVMTRVAAPTTLVLVEDSAGGESAVAVPGQPATATPTSVAVGCAGAGATLIEVTVATTATQVRIWANAPVEPTELTIAVARAASGGAIAVSTGRHGITPLAAADGCGCKRDVMTV